MLQKIAHRLNHGPSPAQDLPELDASDLESEMAELSRQRSAAAELAAYTSVFELDATPLDTYIRRANGFQGETSSSRDSAGEGAEGHSPGAYNEPQDLQADAEQASPGASRQVMTADRKWEGNFF